MGPAAAGGRAGPRPRAGAGFRGTVAWARQLTWRVARPSISAVRVRLGNTRPGEAKVTVTSDPGERRRLRARCAGQRLDSCRRRHACARQVIPAWQVPTKRDEFVANPAGTGGLTP